MLIWRGRRPVVEGEGPSLNLGRWRGLGSASKLKHLAVMRATVDILGSPKDMDPMQGLRGGHNIIPIGKPWSTVSMGRLSMILIVSYGPTPAFGVSK